MSNHAAHFPVHVLHQALSGASNRHESRECAALFLPPSHLSQQQNRKEGTAMNDELKLKRMFQLHLWPMDEYPNFKGVGALVDRLRGGFQVC